MAAFTTFFPGFFMLALGFIARVKGWITLEQKNGANAIIFKILSVSSFIVQVTSEQDEQCKHLLGHLCIISIEICFITLLPLSHHSLYSFHIYDLT